MMKTCEEKANCVFARIAEEKEVRRVRSQKIKRAAVPAWGLCLAAALGFGAWQSGIPGQAPDTAMTGAPEGGAYVSNLDGGTYEREEKTDGTIPVISYFEGDGEESYKAPHDGEVNMSTPLKKAIDAYGDSVNYHVIVQVLKDGQPFDINSTELQAEMDRLNAMGCTVAFDNMSSYGFPLLISMKQIQSLFSDENYGYMLFLYGEFGGETPSQVQDAPADAGGAIYREQTAYPEDIMDLQRRISEDMTAGKLPFVTSSSIVENPLRLEICVNTQDSKLIDRVKDYDSNGKYISIVQSNAGVEE